MVYVLGRSFWLRGGEWDVGEAVADKKGWKLLPSFRQEVVAAVERGGLHRTWWLIGRGGWGKQASGTPSWGLPGQLG